MASAPGASDLPSGDPRRGEPLYRYYCAVCHGATGEGDGPNAASMEDDRPRDLTDARYMSRLTDAQLRDVIQRGGAAVGRSRFMPAWGHTFSAEQIADLIAYTRTLSAQPPRTAPATPGTLEAAGARLVAELGCTGCHRIGDLPAPPVAPDLSNVGVKLQRPWLETFLRQPHRIRPTGYVPLSRSRMPDFRLSAEESRQLAAYLDRLRPKAEPRVGGFPAPAEWAGEKLFLQLACRACHTFEGRGGQSGPDLSAVPQRLQTPWVAHYILDPQAIDPRSPMPRPGVTPGEAWALTATLQGGTAASSPGIARASEGEEEQATRGATLFRELACRACHRRSDEELPERVGPDLTFTGDKLKPTWIAGYLRQPHPVRPWLQARMPTFGLTETEVEQVTAFLVGLREKGHPGLPPQLQTAVGPSPDLVRSGGQL
ncbi:MAG: c-type cytochrome, partial [Candidatus Methylomirabilota bacterium]